MSKNKKFQMNWFRATTAGAALTAGLVAGCNYTPPPSNLALSQSDAQKVENDRLQVTKDAHEIARDIRSALTPVETALRDLSNAADLKIDGKSGSLRLDQGFRLLDHMLEKIYRSAMIHPAQDGTWTITQDISLDGTLNVDGCNSAQAELTSKVDGNHQSLELNLLRCDSPKVFLAEVQKDGANLNTSLHFENLKELSISATTQGATCQTQIKTSVDAITSSLVCNPFEILLGSTHVEVSQLSLNVDQENVTGTVSATAYDEDGNEIASLNYPKTPVMPSDTPYLVELK